MSRPRRTRVYNANYNIGESLYKPALDRLDRKYSGRSLDSPISTPPPPVSFDLPERLDRAFDEEDMPTARRRAEKHITEDTIFDSRGALTKRDGIKLTAVMNGDDEFDEEISNSLKRIRENRKKLIDDIDLEGTVSSMTTKRDMGLSEKLLDSVGINDVTARRIQNGESSIISKRRSFNFEDEFDEAPVQAKWTALRDEETSAAALRAKQSRARLQDLENEMEAINDRQAARERRVKQLKAFIADNEDDSSFTQKSSLKSAKISARSEKKTVTF